MATVVRDSYSDFNGDGQTDILWRSVSSGEIYTWISDPAGGFRDYSVLSRSRVPFEWHVAGLGDFNGDHMDDILWRRDDGQIRTWLAAPDGSFVDNSAASTVGVPRDWHIEGVGDFDGDGRDDILWRDVGGLLVTWLGTQAGGFSDNYLNSVIAVPTQWHVAAIGDFNRDGRDDILWRNDEGTVTDWLGQAGGNFAENYFQSVAAVPLEWQVAGIGDFNGDGRSDILWRHQTGVISDWLATSNSGFINNYENSVSNMPLDGHVAAIGDYNGDGRDDIFWRHDNGDIINWAANVNGGFAYNPSYSMFSGQDPSWHVQGEQFF